MRLNPFLLIVLLYATFLTACNRKALIIDASMEGCLIPESSYLYDSLLAINNEKMLHDTTDCNSKLKNRFSGRTIDIAQDMRITPLLCELIKHEKNPTSSELVYIKTELQQHLLACITDLNSLNAEITCERERMQELLDALSGWINTRVNKTTVYSILAGTVTTAVAGAIALEGKEEKPYFEQGIAVGGAVAGAYWGFRSLLIKHRIKYLHDRNHLRDIWYKQSQSQIYSPYIWNYLSKPFKLKGKMTSGLDLVLDKWKALELPTASDDKKYRQKIDLMLGLGGEYHVEDLESRLKMYEILVDEIITINYNLNRLQEEIILGYKPR